MQVDRPSPPQWLRSWRHLVKRTMEWARRAQRFLLTPLAISSTPSTACPKRKAKAKAAPAVLATTPPAGPACDHRHIKRSGNRHGSYAQCMECKKKWKWNPDRQGWEYFVTASGSSPLPLPSSSTVVDGSWEINRRQALLDYHQGPLPSSFPPMPETAVLAAATPKRQQHIKPSQASRQTAGYLQPPPPPLNLEESDPQEDEIDAWSLLS